MQKRKAVIRAFHPNGYSGVLYGESSMIIYYNEEKCLMTYKRAVNTKAELLEILETMPELMKLIGGNT